MGDGAQVKTGLYDRLHTYLMRELHKGSDGSFDGAGVTYSGTTPVYELALPKTGMAVKVCMDEEEAHWFEVPLPSGDVRIRRAHELFPEQADAVESILAANGL